MSSPEDDAYLYDKSGAPDADVERLEKLLRPIGRSDDDVVPAMTRPAPRPSPAIVRWILVTVAAAAALLFVWLRPSDSPPAWHHEPFGKDTAVGEEADDVVSASGPVIRVGDASAPASRGDWIEATSSSRQIDVGDLSRVTLAAGSRLQVRHVSDETTRLYLQRGKLEARVSADARPRFFQVDTDAARCVDLGCRYTLEVDTAGDATVRVTTGQVAFETPTREVFVPAGAVCVARKDHGPGTPRFEDARPDVRAAFDAYDAASSQPAAVRADLARKALATVTDKRDTLPAWHLLQDADADVVRAASAKLEAVGGACAIAASATPAEAREAWKEQLHGTCW